MRGFVWPSLSATQLHHPCLVSPCATLGLMGIQTGIRLLVFRGMSVMPGTTWCATGLVSQPLVGQTLGSRFHFHGLPHLLMLRRRHKHSFVQLWCPVVIRDHMD